jgi:hypothetical protein
MKKKTIIITAVGLVLGTAEALLYYNLGKSTGGTLKYQIPPGKELLKTVGLVLITSLLTASLSGFIESRLTKKENQPV